MVKNTRRLRGGNHTNEFSRQNPMHNSSTCETKVENQIKTYTNYLKSQTKYISTHYEPLYNILLNEIKRSGNIYNSNNVSTAEQKQQEYATKIALNIQKQIINEIKKQLTGEGSLFYSGKKKSFIDHCNKGTDKYPYTAQNNSNFTIYYKYNNSIPTLGDDIRYIRLFNNNQIVPIEEIFNVYIKIRTPGNKNLKIFGGVRKQTQRRNSNRKRTSKRKN